MMWSKRKVRVMTKELEALERLAMPDDYRNNDRARDYDTIKNYILKTQESKQYL